MTYGVGLFGVTLFGASSADTGPAPTFTAFSVFVGSPQPVFMPFSVTVYTPQPVFVPFSVTVYTPVPDFVAFDVTVEAQQPSLTLFSVRVAPVVAAHVVAFRVVVVTPGASPSRWRPVVTLGGVDISAQLTGAIRVEAGESAARIASFAMVPSAGSVNVSNWTGKRVTIDFAEADSAWQTSNAQRLFTGVVDVPEYDIGEGVASFECTDLRQEVLANTPRAWFDVNIGGYYSAAVAGDATDNLQYAQARLDSVSAALELDAYQAPRVTPWAVSTPYAAHGQDDVLEGSLGFSMASRRDLRNVVEVETEYRFTRLRSRTTRTSWFIAGDWRAKENLPTKQMVQDALGNLPGWSLQGGIGFEQPPAGSSSWNGGVYIMPANVATQLCISWSARHAARWTQTVTERSVIRVRNDASVAAIGEARETRRGVQMVADYDAAQWLDDFSTSPVLEQTISGDWAFDTGEVGNTDRAALADALEAETAIAQTLIRGSHRATRVMFAALLRPDYDLTHTYSVDASMLDGRRVQATGKAVLVEHTMDVDTGEATTHVEMAISGHGAVGVQPYEPPAAPAQPADPTPAPGAASFGLRAGTYSGRRSGAPPFNPETMIGFVTNQSADDAQGSYDPFGELYPVHFSVESPAIEASARDPLELTTTTQFAVDVPQDYLEVTI